MQYGFAGLLQGLHRMQSRPTELEEPLGTTLSRTWRVSEVQKDAQVCATTESASIQATGSS